MNFNRLFFTWVLLLQCLLIIAATHFIGENRQEDAQIAQQQLGLERAARVSRFLVAASEYRGACTANKTFIQASPEVAEECRASGELLEGQLPAILSDTTLSERWAALDTVKGTLPLVERLTAINEFLLDYLQRLYRQSQFELEADEDLYLLGRLSILELPRLVEFTAQLRGQAALHMAGSVADTDDLNQVLGSVREVVDRIRFVFRGLSNEVRNSQQVQQAETALKLTPEQFRAFTKVVSREINADTDSSLSVRELFNQGSATIESQLELHDLVISLARVHLESKQTVVDQSFGFELLLGLALQAALMLGGVSTWRTSKREQAASALAHSAQQELAKQLDKQKRVFAVVGHELRTPASSLFMGLEQLTKFSERPLVKQLHEEAEHLLGVIDDMRIASDNALSGGESVATFSLSESIQRVGRSLRPLAMKSGIRLSFEHIPQTGQHIGVLKPVRQIVTNLVKNALLHSEGEHVDIDVQLLPATDTHDRVEILIKDDGVGIPEDQLERLFEAYQRGESKSEGTGLGLYICKKLAESLKNGRLDIMPNPRGGTSFMLSFDLQRKSEEVAKLQDSEHCLQGSTILFVEDTPTLRLLGEQLLRSAGAKVISAGNGVDALAVAQGEEFDLVVTDIMMPHMDGYELCEALRKRGCEQPIIGVTGATVGDEAQRLLDAGATAVLPKPLRIADLQALYIEFVLSKAVGSASQQSNIVDISASKAPRKEG